MTELFSPLIERAMRVAARSHRDQHRKATDLPYLSHPASVAMILLRAGYREDALLAAALLHDVIEDTDYPPDELAAEFPADVVQIVQSLSEHKTDDAGVDRPWKIRKLEHLEEIAGASDAAKAVTLADKLHNLGSMLLDLQSQGEAMWDRFNAPKDEVFWYHEAMIDAAGGNDERIASLQSAALAVLAQLRNPAESTDSR